MATHVRRMQLRFWQGLQKYAQHNGNVRLTGRPALQPSYDVAKFEKAGVVLQACASTVPRNLVVGPHELRLQLKLFESDADRLFRKLKAQRDEIHGELGFELTWHPPEGKVRRRAYCLYDGPIDFEDKASHSMLYDWLLERTEAIQRVFLPRVRDPRAVVSRLEPVP